MNKYNARKTPYEGYIFDSGKECQRYKDLRLLEKAGELYDLRVHPVYLLQGKFICHGKNIRAIKYEADFEYKESTPIADYPDAYITIVEDVKGMQTEVFRIKSKLFMKRYPYCNFRIVE